MKYPYFFLCILCINIMVNGMKQPQKTKTSYDSLSLITLPDDIHLDIFNNIAPLSHWQNNHLNLRAITKTAKTFQLVCKNFNIFFSVKRITPLMRINSFNKNILLLHAAQHGSPGLVKYAINKKATLDYIDKKNGQTPLSNAAQENNYKCCFLLLKAGANVNKPAYTNEPKAYLPINVATRNGFFEITKLLLDYKAIINEQCPFCNKTPLEHLLAENWRSPSIQAPIVKLLIDYGATVPEKYKEKTADLLAII